MIKCKSMDLKENFAVNLIRYRKEAKLTQAELAEKLNYSDKAVSKWERGESIPDIYTLKNIAEFFGTTVDSLVEEPKEGVTIFKTEKKKKGKTHLLISLCSVGLVWLIATCCFSFLEMIIPDVKETWLAFVYALPVSFIILTVFSAVWGKKLINKICISGLVWTLLAAIHISIITLATNPSSSLWTLYLIGAPLQIIVIFWHCLERVKQNS